MDLEERNVTVFEGLSRHTILTEKIIKSWLGIESEHSSVSGSDLMVLNDIEDGLYQGKKAEKAAR